LRPVTHQGQPAALALQFVKRCLGICVLLLHALNARALEESTKVFGRRLAVNVGAQHLAKDALAHARRPGEEHLAAIRIA
jgi:hypothetical protein